MGSAMQSMSISRQNRRLGFILLGGFALALSALLLLPLLADRPLSDPLPWILFSLTLTLTLLVVARHHRGILARVRTEVIGLNDIAAAIAAGRTPTGQDRPVISIRELERVAESIDRMEKRAEEDIAALKRLEQVRGEFLGNVSHELRTPIFTVQGFLETLLDGAVDDPEVRDEFLQKAHDNLIRLHALLNDLIEISRIESGALKLSFRDFDLVDLARGTLHNLSDKAALSSVSLGIDVRGANDLGEIKVYGDRKRIEQALVNLLDNAIKYNRPEGSVLLRIGVENGTVRLSVRDDGPGIAPIHLDRIFERFYRIDRGRSREVGGSGLGLAIVKHIVEAHGSSIEVLSDGRNGSTFSFTLPRLA